MGKGQREPSREFAGATSLDPGGDGAHLLLPEGLGHDVGPLGWGQR